MLFEIGNSLVELSGIYIDEKYRLYANKNFIAKKMDIFVRPDYNEQFSYYTSVENTEKEEIANLSFEYENCIDVVLVAETIFGKKVSSLVMTYVKDDFGVGITIKDKDGDGLSDGDGIQSIE